MCVFQSRLAARVSMAAQVIDHMERHLAEPVLMDALARQTRISRARLQGGLPATYPLS